MLKSVLISSLDKVFLDTRIDTLEPLRSASTYRNSTFSFQIAMTETACDATTVSGWVMEALGCIPSVGDAFTADGLSVEVTKVETTRPEEIRVWKAAEQEE